MNEILKTGFLGDDPSDALAALKAAINSHVLPFLADWWDPEDPIPTEDEIAALQDAIAKRAEQAPLADAYRELPELLKLLAQGFRFNRRNYVNIHPSPFVPSTRYKTRTISWKKFPRQLQPWSASRFCG